MAALPLAALNGRNGSWIVSGTSEDAAEYLNHGVSRLVGERLFPRPNLVTEPISWSFHGTPQVAGNRGWLSRLHRGPRQVDFVLELHDPPGGFFQAGHVEPQAIEYLANAQGIIYLMDPLSTPEDDPSFRYFYEALQLLATRMSGNGQLRNGRLPQFVAVCVTKFDDPTLFRQLVRETTLVTQDSQGEQLPRVPAERSREFFDFVCDRILGARAGLVRQALTTFFDPRRIEYFATSAIGFRLNTRQEFDYQDFANIRVDNGDARVRDLPRPINVLEPLIFLEQRIRGDRHR